MTGCRANADRALAMFMAHDTTFEIGDGWTRSCYLLDGIVYKIANNPSDNLSEWDNIVANGDFLPEGVFFPSTSLYFIGEVPVIAMKFIEGQLKAECFCVPGETCDAMCMSDRLHDIVSVFIDDTSGANVIVNDEGIWIIDAAL